MSYLYFRLSTLRNVRERFLRYGDLEPWTEMYEQFQVSEEELQRAYDAAGVAELPDLSAHYDLVLKKMYEILNNDPEVQNLQGLLFSCAHNDEEEAKRLYARLNSAFKRIGRKWIGSDLEKWRAYLTARFNH